MDKVRHICAGTSHRCFWFQGGRTAAAALRATYDAFRVPVVTLHRVASCVLFTWPHTLRHDYSPSIRRKFLLVLVIHFLVFRVFVSYFSRRRLKATVTDAFLSPLLPTYFFVAACALMLTRSCRTARSCYARAAICAFASSAPAMGRTPAICAFDGELMTMIFS